MRIKVNRKIILLILLLLVSNMLSYYLGVNRDKPSSKEERINNITIAIPKESNFEIPDGTISKLSNLLAEDSQEIFKTTKMYFNSRKLLFVETIGIGCASCHQRWLYLFDFKGNKLWETTADDGTLGGFTNDQFFIIEPIRKDSAPFSKFKGRYFKVVGRKIVEVN